MGRTPSDINTEFVGFNIPKDLLDEILTEEIGTKTEKIIARLTKNKKPTQDQETNPELTQHIETHLHAIKKAYLKIIKNNEQEYQQELDKKLNEYLQTKTEEYNAIFKRFIQDIKNNKFSNEEFKKLVTELEQLLNAEAQKIEMTRKQFLTHINQLDNYIKIRDELWWQHDQPKQEDLK